MDKEKLRKVAKLAEFGIGGERDAANFILKEQGTTAKEVLSEKDEEEIFVTIGFKTRSEKQIIVQNYCRLFNVDVVHSWRGHRNITVGLPPDKAKEFVDTCELLKKRWRKELKTLEDAFIQKNGLFSDLPGTGESGLSPEEVLEIMRMARAMRQIHLGKCLEAGDA
jgi:hypothetical protein